MDALIQDLRQALRGLARTPGFTIVAALTLALGIGAATAGFSLLNWLLLRPVPGVHDGARLADVWFGVHKGGGVQPSFVSYEHQAAILAGVPSLSGMTGRQSASVSFAVGDAIPGRLSAEFVSPSYFDVLGARPALGRGFTDEDDRFPDGARAVVISDRVWREWFGSRADVQGQTVRINALPFSVIGVAPRQFHGPERLGEVDVWLPGRTYADVSHFPALRARWNGSGSGGYYAFVARLAAGATFPQAEQQLHTAIQRAGLPDSTVTAKVYPGIGLFALGREGVVRPLRLVMGIVALVLIIACANVANLLLLRGAGRRGETAVRIALGAGPRRLVQQHAAEAVVLAGLGAGAGVLLAVWLTALFQGTQLVALEVRDVGLDWRVAAFAVAIALVTALLVAVAPALAARRTDVSAALKSSAAQVTHARAPLRGSLVVLQLAASLTLVVGALLLIRTFAQLTRVPLGMDPAGVVAFAVQPRDVGFDGARTRVYYREVLSRIDALPGVDRATIAVNVPFVCCSQLMRTSLPGAEALARIEVYSNAVGAGYFEALSIPVVLGRTFTHAEMLTDSAIVSPPAVLSLGLARRLFGTANPVGQLLETPRYRAASLRPHVVGVVGDSRWNDLERDVPLMLYLPLGYDGRVDQAQLLVRSPTDVSAAVARAARTLDADLPLGEPKAILVGISRQLSARLLLLRLLGALSLVTVVLAGVGLYGLVSHGVTLRTREFGIRIALGAAERRILKTAMRDGLRLAVAGIVLGALGAVALTRVLRAYLFGVSPLDPVSLIVAVAVLALAALLASWIPARRAARVDPMVALRSE